MNFDLPPVTRALLIANVAVFLLQKLFGQFLLAYFALWPWGPAQHVMGAHGVVVVGFHFWQLITYAFMHGSITHIFFNMFALYMFGGPIERTLGARHFIIYYFVCAVAAAIAQLIVVHWFTHGFYPTIGASGGIFGVLLAFGVLYPHQKLMLLFPPIPLSAWIFVSGYIVLELVLGVTGSEAGVAHFAHLGGALAGFIMIEYWRGHFPIKPQRRLMR